MARQITISKLQTGNADLDRVQEHLREKLNPILASLPSAPDFRWMQINGADQTVADTWALQFRTTGTTWATILSVTSAGQIVQPAWTAVTYTNGWADIGGPWQTVSYMKDSIGVVHLRGSMTAGTIGLSSFTLPGGFRPAAQVQFPVVSNGLFGYFRITGAGTATPIAGSNVAFDLNGITWDTR